MPAGASDFVSQPKPFRDAPYVRNLVVTARPFRGQAQLPWDDAVRTGTFVKGTRDVWFRLELGEYAGGVERVQIVRPDGSLAVDEGDPAKTPDGIGQGHGMAAFDVHERVQFDSTGTWRLRYQLDGQTLADAPLRVVVRAAQVRNRPPFAVTASLVTTPGIAQCVVATSLAVRDPDYDVVRYRYRWSAAGEVLRSVTSAGALGRARSAGRRHRALRRHPVRREALGSDRTAAGG